MAVVGTGLTSGSSTTTTNVYNTASVTPSANCLELLAVWSRFSVTDTTISSVTGNGLTWVEAASQAGPSGATDRTMRLFRAMGGSPSAGAITITYAHNQQTTIAWTLVEFSGVDTTGTNGSGALLQPTGATQTTGSNIAATLAAFGSANNGTYGNFAILKATTSTPGTGFSELYDFQTNAIVTTTTEWRNDNSTSVGVTWASNTTSQFGIAAEIAAASAPKSLIVPRRSSTLIRT